MEPASTGSTNGSVFVGASRLRAEVRRSPPPEVRPLPWREAERMGVGGYPQTPTKEGCALYGLSRRAGSSPRGSGCDVHQVHCFATRFGEINDQLIDSLLKQG